MGETKKTQFTTLVMGVVKPGDVETFSAGPRPAPASLVNKPAQPPKGADAPRKPEK